MGNRFVDDETLVRVSVTVKTEVMLELGEYEKFKKYFFENLSEPITEEKLSKLIPDIDKREAFIDKYQFATSDAENSDGLFADIGLIIK